MAYETAKLKFAHAWISIPMICMSCTSGWAQTFEEAFQLRPVRLSMRQVLAGVLAKSLDLKINELDIQIAESRIDAAWAAFDPVFQLGGSLQDSRIAQNAQEYVQTGGLFIPLSEPNIFRQRNLMGETGLAWRIPTGTTVELFTRAGSFLNDLNRQSPPALFSPERAATVGMSLTQPLLRDFGFSANLAEVRVSRLNARIADLEWQQKLMEVVAGVMREYYALCFVTENIEVRRGVLAFAQTLLHENERQREEGVGGLAEVEEAKVGVAMAREEVVTAMGQAIERQRALKTQLLSVAQEAQAMLFVPSDTLPPAITFRSTRSRCLAEALAARPDHLRLLEDAEKQDVILKFARNQALPRLDLKATLGASGLAGGMGAAYNRVLDRQGYNASVGFEFSMPLGNRAAKANRDVAEARKEQAVMAVARSEMHVVAEVEEALGLLQAAAARLSYTRESVAAADLLLAAEQKRFKQGVARSFDVLRARRQVADARSRELAALADWNAAHVVLHARTGSLLEHAGLRLDSPEDQLPTDSRARPVQ
jgi:outer membrane protein TolC